jgi:hypothetical protein
VGTAIWAQQIRVGAPFVIPNADERVGTGRPIVAKHDKAHEMFFLNRLKPEFARDPQGCAPNQAFAAECSRLFTGFSGS